MSADGRTWRVAFVGAGYISAYHAEALRALPGAQLTAVCDANTARARALADRWGCERVHASPAELLAAGGIDVVHVLTPPDAHAAIARAALETGVHVLLEKPMAPDPEACAQLVALAAERELVLGVSHNFLFAEPYEQLRADLAAGRLGRLQHVSVSWKRELAEATRGPFDAFALRRPTNVLLEVGVHSLAHLLDLVGEPERLDVVARHPIDLPGGGRCYRSWQVHAWAGETSVDLHWLLGPGFEEHRLEVQGTLGSGWVDLANDTYWLDRATRYAFDFDRFHRVRRRGRALLRQARRTLTGYALSKLWSGARGEPYGDSIRRSVSCFYEQLEAAAGRPPDARIGASFGRRVVELAVRIGERSGVGELEEAAKRAAPAASGPAARPRILVLGGTGFIGRELVRQLLAAGHGVRVLARNPGAAVFEGPRSRLELLRGDLRSREDLTEALEGIECVYHLAKTDARSFAEYRSTDIEPARMLAELCLEHAVKRLVFTGTIDSLYLGPGAGRVSDETPLDPGIRNRNNYARAKAEIEALLSGYHRERGLPLVICRPAIVIGSGGNPCHGGIGIWNGLGVCQILGDGAHALPLVLVEDVAAALVALLDRPGVEGRTYNLSAPPSLSALEYVHEIEQHTGFEIQAVRVSAWRFFLADLAKWLVKLAVRHPDASRRPTLRDWRCREQHAAFDSAGARRDLGWEPVAERAELIERGIRRPLDEWLR